MNIKKLRESLETIKKDIDLEESYVRVVREDCIILVEAANTYLQVLEDAEFCEKYLQKLDNHSKDENGDFIE